jgi:hypothetical protein
MTTNCVISEEVFRGGCDAVTGELRNAWTALDRAYKKTLTTLARWGDDQCHAHGGAISQTLTDIDRIKRSVERLEVEVRRAGTPRMPSPL